MNTIWWKENRKLTLLVLFSLFYSVRSYGATDKASISWGMLTLGLLGGLALFLYGMELMSEGMKKTAGDRMRSILAILTKNRVIALFCGVFVTMVIQSSSATTVMLVSFVQAGLMSFVQSMGVILGSGIGTTITAQMIAFKLTDLALLIVVIGFLVRLLGKSDGQRNIGEAILGFGILFFGMKLMSDAMKPLRTYPEFINILSGLETPIFGILVGTLFTALIQSSSAFTGIIIVLAQQGLISLEAGIFLVFGANVGTCVTAGLASIGTSREAKRVALAHVIFKIGGVLLFIFWVPTFAGMIRSIAASFDSGPARQIANAHTIFNIGLTLAFLPFTTLFGKLIIKLLPDKEVDGAIKLATWHLDYDMISTPSLAIDLARVEVSRMAKLLGRMLEAVIVPFFSNDEQRDAYFPELTLLEGIDMREEKLDFLDDKIDEYLMRVSKERLTESNVNEIFKMMSIAKDIESIGDLIHRNMIPLIAKKKSQARNFSEEGKEELNIYHTKVRKQIKLLEEAFLELDLEKARQIMGKERKYLDLELKYRANHLRRLILEKQETVGTHEIHMELMDLMKQIVVYSSHIATVFLSSGPTD